MPQTGGQKRGHALSVFRGSTLEPFNVEIIAKYKGGGAAGQDIYVARVTGAVIDRIGGVPLGASGSPVYVNGKLIGAISGTYPPDNYLITITPIRNILGLRDEPSVVDYPEGNVNSLSPPLVSGISAAKALGQLEQALGRKVVPAPPADGLAALASKAPMKAGMPIGVALMTGDIRVGYIGTVTTVRDGGVYAFGHPVTFSGPVCMPMTSAVIFDTARGLSPFKVGDIGTTIGTVTQDRAAGIYGRLGVEPGNLVKVEAKVKDVDRSSEQSVRTSIVNIPDQVSRLAVTAVIETFARAMNRVGQGTSEWEWTISFGDGQSVTQSGRTVNASDIGFATAAELWQPLDQYVNEGKRIAAVRLRAVVMRVMAP